ncbi:MATE family efflux transporter, partial [Kitasatospora sp. NPDC093558]|uniref:MATE family efflux transporter n=1 Tax=Kitasatospora sp. NPDC093558 TaxID=3155201 RepID=UPI0034152A76
VGTAQLALVAGFGVSAVAGYGIGYRVLLVVTMAFYALRQAAAIEAARLVGAGGGAELRELAHATGRFAAVLGAGAAVSAVLLAGPVSGLFTDDLAVTAQSAGFLRMTAPYLLPYALVVALGGVHQAVGAGRALVVSVALGLAAQLGSAAVLSGPLGVNGVWAGLTVGAVVQLALLRMLTRRRTTPPTSGHRTDRTSRSDRSGGSGRSGRSGHPDPGVALDAAAGRRGPAQAVLRPRRFPGAGVAAE